MGTGKLLKKISNVVIIVTLTGSHVASAGPIGFDANVKTRMEAGLTCKDGLCFQHDGGLDDVVAKLEKANVFKRLRGARKVNPRTQISRNDLGAVGRVFQVNSKGEAVRDSWGSGTMVSPCMMLTACHAVFPDFDDSKAPTKKIKFELMNSDGRSFKEVIGDEVVASDCSPNLDFALVKLKTCEGKRPEISWADLVSKSAAGWAEKRYQSAGFAGDMPSNKLTIDPDCRAGVKPTKKIDFPKGNVMHFCASMPGDSGGPIFTFNDQGVMELVAVQRAPVFHNNGVLEEEDEEYANLAVEVRSFRSRIIQKIEEDIQLNGSSVTTVARSKPKRIVLSQSI